MPRGLNVDIQAMGSEAATAFFHGIARRFLNLIPAWERVENILEAGEERHFKRLKGRYVDSGDLKASLTQADAAGALREAHRDEYVFGTSIFYARFQRKGKKSAVLVLQPKTRREASAVIADHVMGRL